MKRIFKWLFVVLMAFLLFHTGIVYADDTPQNVVKVGFPVQPGISYINERGDHAGYLVDYLNQLNFFTNWEVEYVQVEGDLDTQLETLMSMLEAGEIDVLGTMNRTPELEQRFLYPDYSYGTAYTTLAVLENNYEWIAEDFSHWDGIRIAICPDYDDRYELLANYATVNEFRYELVECADYDDMIQAVKDGRADAMLQVDISLTDGFRNIGRFSPSPYYFAISLGEHDLLQQLNTAMRSLTASQPNLQNELYDLHFEHTQAFQISQAHQDYIRSLGTLKVLFFAGNAPYQWVKDGEVRGFAYEYIQRFAQTTGLQYEPVIADSYEQALEMAKNGEVDLVACVATNSSMASLQNVSFTLPFLNSFSVTACANPKPHVHPTDLEFRVNTEQALTDIQTTENYGVRADYYSLSYYLRKDVIYDDIIVDWANTKSFSYVVGVTGSVSDQLIAILNQYATSLSNETKLAMLYHYSSDPVEYTPQEWLKINRIFLLIFAVVVIFFGYLLFLQNRSKRSTYKALLAEKRLLQLTMYDPITGAYNETYFRELLEERCKNKENGALVAFNIRGFKYINDTYGVKRANQLLCSIKSILDNDRHQGELFCRATADLFYLFLNEQNSAALSVRMNEIFAKIVAVGADTLDGHPMVLYSGGVFTAGSPSPFNVSAKMSYMMVALVHAKRINFDGVYVFDEQLYKKEELRYYIETHMRKALQNEEYQLYLQPKTNLHTGRVDSAEALVRWQPADRGMIFPNQFIPMFEENGFCVELDLYMVEQVCKKLRIWLDQGFLPITISVNQTKALFVKDDYVESLLAITKRYDISPRYIILEILEGLAFENVEALNKTIQSLKDVGFRVSMDDFGSGYSSLNTLGKLKIDELKLDRMFLMDVAADKHGAQSEVLASVFALAKKLGMTTVAEGVENKESEEMMRTMACDYGQGYYYSKPIPADEFESRFLNRPSTDTPIV